MNPNDIIAKAVLGAVQDVEKLTAEVTALKQELNEYKELVTVAFREIGVDFAKASAVISSRNPIRSAATVSNLRDSQLDTTSFPEEFQEFETEESKPVLGAVESVLASRVAQLRTGLVPGVGSDGKI